MLIKKILLAIIAFPLSIFGMYMNCYAQNVIINDDHLNHNQYYFSYDSITSPDSNNTVTISGSSNVKYTAVQKIKLQPGFKVIDPSGNGNFNAHIYDQPDFSINIIEPDTTSNEVGMFEKLELGIALPNNIKFLTDTFLNHPPQNVFEDYYGLNPFNPDDISIEAHFRSVDFPGTEEKIVFGFYYKNYDYIELNPEAGYWEEVPTTYNWRVRFAPDKSGLWSTDIFIRFKSDPTLPTLYHLGFEFNCTTSTNPGYIVQNENNPRMLKFSESNEQFFGIGLNIAWPTKWIPPEYGYYYVNEPGRFVEHRNWFRDLAVKNGNFARLVITPFDYNYEWEMVNFYDSKISIDTISWSKNETKYDLVGRLALAWEMDSLITLCEDLGIYISLCHELHFQFASSHPNSQGYEYYPYIWPNNPYNTIPGVDSVSDFLTNELAQKYYKFKIRYMASRWGYSSAILGHELLSEIDQVNCIGAYAKGNEKAWEYCPYSDPSEKGTHFIEDLNYWHNEMMAYIKDSEGLNYTNHLYSTSYGGVPKEIDSIFYNMDFTSLHLYHHIQFKNKSRYLYYKNFFLNRPELWEKPFYYGELGLTGTTENGCGITGYYACDDLSFHNDLWATAAFSSISGGMHWWWNKGIIDYHLQNLHPLVTFFNSIDLVGNEFSVIGSKWDDQDKEEDLVEFEYYFSRTNNHEVIFGWVHNYNVYWENFIYQHQNCLGDPEIGWTENCIPLIPPVIDPVYAEIVFDNIEDNQSFTLQKYNTRSSEFLPPEVYTSTNGSLIIPFGDLGNDPDNNIIPPDYGFIIIKN